jgi:hypothetical protein
VASNGVSFTVGSIAPPALVQVNYAVPQTPQTTVTVTYTQAQTAGNLNVVIVGWNDSTAQVQSVTDTKGNVYVLAVGPTVITGIFNAIQAIYYAKNIAAATAGGNTVTVTFTVPAVFPDIRIAEYSGIDPSVPVDVVAAAQGSGTSSDSGSVTTGNANDLLVGTNLVQTVTTGPGAGYTSRVITIPNGDILEDRAVTATGSYNATAPVSPSGSWIMQLVAFRAAGSPPPPPATLVSIAVTPANPSITKGATQQFTATGRFSDSTTQVLSNALWASGTGTVATISNTGLATTVGAGTSTISATVGSITGSTLLTVNPAPAPGIQVSSTSINFGNGVVGNTLSQALIITNTGTATLSITQVTETGSAFFTVSGFSLPLNVNAGQQTTITVTFLPTLVGSASGSISIVSNAPTSPTSVGLSGTGIAATRTLNISPTSLSFGSITTNTSSAPQTVTITNTGNSNVTISQISVNGAGYSITGGGTPVTLSPSQTLTLTALFSPTATGSVNGSISIVSNANGSPASVSLSGTGVAAVQHSVALTWNASTSTVSGYNVYRSTVSGSGYTKLNSSLVSGLAYTDSSVQNSTTYFYVTTAVDSGGKESIYSNEVSAVIP